jgi:hypothetical protein
MTLCALRLSVTAEKEAPWGRMTRAGFADEPQAVMERTEKTEKTERTEKSETTEKTERAGPRRRVGI